MYMRDGQIEIKRLGWVGGVREKERGGRGGSKIRLEGGEHSDFREAHP